MTSAPWDEATWGINRELVFNSPLWFERQYWRLRKGTAAVVGRSGRGLLRPCEWMEGTLPWRTFILHTLVLKWHHCVPLYQYWPYFSHQNGDSTYGSRKELNAHPAGGNAVILECVSSTEVVFARHLLHNQMWLCAAETLGAGTEPHGTECETKRKRNSFLDN